MVLTMLMMFMSDEGDAHNAVVMAMVTVLLMVAMMVMMLLMKRLVMMSMKAMQTIMMTVVMLMLMMMAMTLNRKPEALNISTSTLYPVLRFKSILHSPKKPENVNSEHMSAEETLAIAGMKTHLTS